MRYSREYFAYGSFVLLCLVLLIIVRIVLPGRSKADVVVLPPDSAAQVIEDKFHSVPDAEIKRVPSKRRPIRLSLYYTDSLDFIMHGVNPVVCDSIIAYRSRFIMRGSIALDTLLDATPQTIVGMLQPHLGNKKQKRKPSMPHSTVPTSDVSTVETADSQEVKSETIPAREPIVVELNSATKNELCQLYRVGEYTAEKIIERREELGGFVSKKQLLEIHSIKRHGCFDTIAAQLTVDTLLISRLDINSISLSDLSAHPYVGPLMKSRLSKLRRNDRKFKIRDVSQFRKHFSDIGYNELLEKYLVFD